MNTQTSIRSNIIWSTVRNFCTRFGAVIVFFVLARVLEPEQLGLFATVLALIAFMEIIADAGIGDAIIQRKELSERDLKTALNLNLFLGLLLAASIAIFADEISAWMEIEEISDLLAVSAIGLFLNAAAFVPQAYYRRKFDFKWLAYRAFISSLISGALGITLALLGAGPWAMAAQFISLSVVNLVLVWWKRPFLPGAVLDGLALKDMTVFGAALLMSKILYYATTRAIELVIAVSFGPVAIAVYVMGNRIVAVAQQLLSAVTLDVYMPRFSRLVDKPEELKSTLYQALEVTGAIAFPVFLGTAAISPEIIEIAFGNNGTGAEPILRILAILAALQSVLFYCGTLLNACGRPYLALVFQLIRAGFVVAVFILFSDKSVGELLNAFVVVWFALAPVLIFMTWKVVKFSVIQIFLRLLPYIIASVVMLMSLDFLRETAYFIDMNSVMKALIMCLLGAFIYTAIVLVFFRKRFKFVMRSILGKQQETTKVMA
ncbi:lipopolysaccharide biosynthesis protein [Corallincola platygyrae]|uniref:Lipopolysaccharide biosynthesis protein n=1 Tax=Corallincola platygyrae TaxID=1193278 RepID=A0ABW4XKY6_9GAMM